MTRSSLWLFMGLLVAAPLALAQDLSTAAIVLREIEIVGGPETWPDGVYEPQTRLDSGLELGELAERFAYRAAEYTVQAERFRRYGDQAQWPGQNIYGDRAVAYLHEGWARELDEAAVRSRNLSVRVYLAAGETAR
jgi:hypothetical protein